jgi:trans-2,3-dihydro-3-hydroxyanthranilate isomerase
MTQPDPEFGEELGPAEVALLLGLTEKDLEPRLVPQIVSTGNPFAIVVLRSLAALGRLRIDQDEANTWLRLHGGRWFYVLAPALDQNQSPSQQYRARMQFHGGEDPATGSAAGCAIGYLVGRGVVAPGERIHVRQGVEMGRPSDLFLSAQKESARVRDVRVAGSTVLVAKGQLFLT